MNFEMETVREIFNDKDKTKVEVGPDRDGLDFVEIRYRNEFGKIEEHMSFPPALARMVAIALNQCANEIETNHPKVTK